MIAIRNIYLKFILLSCIVTSLSFAQTVYITKTGEKYHSNGCRYTNKSKISIDLQEAINNGYTACKVCSPPQSVSKSKEKKETKAKEKTVKDDELSEPMEPKQIQVVTYEPYNEVKKTDSREIYTVVEEMPEFPGGSMEMMKYIQKNIQYPTEARDKGISGKCFAKFVVNEDGSISDFYVLKGVAGCKECDEEAKRLIESMPKWKPAKLNGKPVPVFFNLPINFTIR